MTTSKENALVDEIYKEGRRKYQDRINRLADFMEDWRDSEPLIHQGCYDIWEELVKLNSKYKRLLEKHGIVIMDVKGDWRDQDAITVRNSGCNIDAIPTSPYDHRGHGYPGIKMFSEPVRPYFGEVHAPDAISDVLRSLNLIDLWTVVAERYNAIRKEIGRIETEKSDKRVKEAKKELERLKKM